MHDSHHRETDTTPEIDIVDDMFITAPPRSLAPIFVDPALCGRQWPDLVLQVLVDRGEEGVQWSVDGALHGSMEVWLEPVLDGTIVHYFLRASLSAAPETAARRVRRIAAENRRRRMAARRLSFALKRRFEGDRAPGCPPGPDSDRHADGVCSGA